MTAINQTEIAALLEEYRQHIPPRIVAAILALMVRCGELEAALGESVRVMQAIRTACPNETNPARLPGPLTIQRARTATGEGK